MKKIICHLLVISMCVLCMGACGSESSSVSDVSSGHSLNLNDNTSVTSTQEDVSINDYKFLRADEFIYKCPSYMYSEGRGSGLKIYKEEYDLVVFCGTNNLGEFKSWDTVVDDSKKELFLTIINGYKPFITPLEQSVTNSEKMVNKNGIELLRVEGTVKGYDDDDKDVQAEYIAYYHLSPSEKTRCFFTLIKDDKYFTSSANKTEADKILSDMAENLKLAE